MSKKPKESGMIYNQTNKIVFVLFFFCLSLLLPVHVLQIIYKSMFYKSSPVQSIPVYILQASKSANDSEAVLCLYIK